MPLLIVLGVLTLFLVVAALFRMLLVDRESLPDAAWLQNFSAARYRPMLRLLAEDDYEFLTALGSDRSVVRRLRSERRRIFRMYLRNLSRDFARLHRAARVLALESEQGSEVAERLIRMRVQFTVAVMAVQFRLTMHALGIGTVDVRNLIQALEGMGANFRSLTPVGGSSIA
jgi:hypothetical protein